MPRTIRFYLDEHVAHAVADGLRRLGIDVLSTTDSGLLGAADADQISFATAESAIKAAGPSGRSSARSN